MNYDVYDVNLMTDEQTVYIFLKADLSIWITKLLFTQQKALWCVFSVQ